MTKINYTILKQHIKWILDTDGTDDGIKIIDHRRFRKGYNSELYPRAVEAMAESIRNDPNLEFNEVCSCSGEPRQFDDATLGEAMTDYAPRITA